MHFETNFIFLKNIVIINLSILFIYIFFSHFFIYQFFIYQLNFDLFIDFILCIKSFVLICSNDRKILDKFNYLFIISHKIINLSFFTIKNLLICIFIL